MTTLLRIHTDGAARSNPGPAAFAYVIDRDGVPPIEECGCLGRLTNNQAEYTALVRALEHATKLGTGHRIKVFSDSELMVKQMRGEYRVKNEDLRELYAEAKKLAAKFPSVTYEHVRREQNRRADELCNEALDGKRKPAIKRDADELPSSKPPPAPKIMGDALRQEAVTCLRAAAAAWSIGNPDNPDPEEVWDRLWELVNQHSQRDKPS
jgi:ribonuclease HI